MPASSRDSEAHLPRCCANNAKLRVRVAKHASYQANWFDSCMYSCFWFILICWIYILMFWVHTVHILTPLLHNNEALTLTPSRMVERAFDDYNTGLGILEKSEWRNEHTETCSARSPIFPSPWSA